MSLFAELPGIGDVLASAGRASASGAFRAYNDKGAHFRTAR